jgi:hypothetical protein
VTALKLPPQILDFRESEGGWVSVADSNRMGRIRQALAVGRAKAKLTVYEYNALALHIAAQVRSDDEYRDTL